MSDAVPNLPSGEVSLRGWIAARWRTLRLVLVGTFSYPIVFLACWHFWPAITPRAAPVDRLLLAVQLCVIPAALLFCCVFACLRLLDTPGAENLLAGAESQRWKINARVLQNTLEQAAIFVPVLLGLAVRIDPAQLEALPILVALWTTGRLLFWAGIHRDFSWRAIGFDWTYYSSLVALGWFAYTLF